MKTAFQLRLMSIVSKSKTLTAIPFLFVLISGFANAQSDTGNEEFSIYDGSILEPLIIMARQLQEAEQHAEALEVFEKAWQVSRVANGLYDESQIDIVQSMIFSDVELENWEAVDQHYDYLTHLYNRVYTIDDPKLEQGLQAIALYHVNALNNNLDGKRIQHLRAARTVLKMRLEIAEVTLEEKDPKFDFLQESIALSERQLYLESGLSNKIIQANSRSERDRWFAGLD